MRAGPAQAWLDRQVTPTFRPEPALLLTPMLVLVAALASPLLMPLPVAVPLVAAALGWVVHRSAPGSDAHVQLVTRDKTAPVDSAISVHVADVDAAYAEAQRRGYRIVHPLTHEEWGVRRFFVQAPDGTVVNMVSHAD